MQSKIFILSILFIFFSCKNNSDTHPQPEVSNPDIEFNADLKLKYPKPNHAVGDFEQLFTAQEISALEHKLTDYKTNSDKEVIIVTVNSIEPYHDIIDFGNALLKSWESGISKNEEGLLIMISKTLGEFSIISGMETSKKVTDEICQKVISTIILPEFENKYYYTGIDIGLTYLMGYWK